MRLLHPFLTLPSPAPHPTQGRKRLHFFPCKSNFLSIIILAALLTTATLFARTWTSTDGRAIEADFVRLDGTNVIVRLRGTDTPIPLSKLSQGDQDWVAAEAKKMPAPAPTFSTKEKPLLVVSKPNSSGDVSLDVSIPAGYSGPALTLESPDGSIETLKYLNMGNLPAFVTAVTALNELVESMSTKDAQTNAAQIKTLADKADDACEAAGISRLAGSAYAGSLGRKAGNALAGGGGSSRDDRSRDEKRADSLGGIRSVEYQAPKGDSDDWKEARAQIRECVTTFSKLSADDRFIYRGERIVASVAAHAKYYGTWRLLAGGQEIEKADIRKP